MIDPPRRSVTHFLVPFIDVTLILFSMFLLLPMASDENQKEDEKKEVLTALTVSEMRLDIAQLNELLQKNKQELEAKTAQLQQFLKQKDVYKQIVELEKKLKDLQEERDKLIKERDLAKKTPNFIRVLDIDPRTGQIFFYDPFRIPDPKLMITDEKVAQALIERHRKEAADRQLFYHFMFPREETGFPTNAQEKTYKRWFAEVPNSLTEKMP